jgi:hypothetical protein
MSRTKYPWADAAVWHAVPSQADDDLADDNAYGTCPRCGPGSTFLLMAFWICEFCGSWPDGPVSRPDDRLPDGRGFCMRAR